VISCQYSVTDLRKCWRLLLNMWIKNSISLIGCVVIVWVVACVPTKAQDVPATIVPPTETLTPGVEESKFVTYQDKKNKFEITYSKDIFTPDLENSNADLFILVLDIGKLFAGKNLENVVVTVSAAPTCRYKASYYEDPDKETINNIDFSVYSARNDKMPTNVFQTLTYQTYNNDLCYEIQLHMKEYSLTAFPDVAEYDPEVIIIEFKNLLGTFKFIE
jgi:hypothetical protein